MMTAFGITALCCCVAATSAAAAAPRVQVTDRPEIHAVDIAVDGEPFTTFHYGPDAPKPYLWPLLGEGGVAVSRGFPMDPDAASRDHPHHRSCWSGHGDVNGVDFWLEGRRKGRQRVVDTMSLSDGAEGRVTARIVWEDPKGRPILDEQREYRFSEPAQGSRAIDIVLRLTAAHGPVIFGDTKEAGLIAVRMRPELQGDRGGRIFNTAGASGEAACWGKRAAWCAYAGNIEGAGTYGVVIFDHPQNPGHPTPWHVRDYGLIAANCFGLAAFTNGSQHGGITLEAGQTVVFRYRLIVHSEALPPEDIAALYAAYRGGP